MKSLNVAGWLGVLGGLVLTMEATRNNVSASGPALGVFFIFLGLNAFTQLRISKVEETLLKMEKTNETKT